MSAAHSTRGESGGRSAPGQRPTAVVQVEGHIIDSLILAKILDVVVESGADYTLVDITVGRSHNDPSSARLELTTTTDEAMERLLTDLHPHGAHLVDEPDAQLEPVVQDGVLPRGFYATTNLPTSAKIDGRWIDVERPEMDCSLVVSDDRSSAWTVPMSMARVGDLVVVGSGGVKVRPLGARRRPAA